MYFVYIVANISMSTWWMCGFHSGQFRSIGLVLCLVSWTHMCNYIVQSVFKWCERYISIIEMYSCKILPKFNTSQHRPVESVKSSGRYRLQTIFLAWKRGTVIITRSGISCVQIYLQSVPLREMVFTLCLELFLDPFFLRNLTVPATFWKKLPNMPTGGSN